MFHIWRRIENDVAANVELLPVPTLDFEALQTRLDCSVRVGRLHVVDHRDLHNGVDVEVPEPSKYGAEVCEALALVSGAPEVLFCQ